MALPEAEAKKFSIVPFGCLYIDASWQDVLAAIPFSLEPNKNRSLIEYKLERLWNHLTPATPTHILPCLSVRTALDLVLSVKKYPAGSEIIFSAINIPDMTRIVRHHGLNVVALDVDEETLSPKVEHIESLITPKTVAILVAHIYGRWSNIDDAVALAKKHNLTVLEDCAESFSGTQNHGHPGADVSFFSFGLIKTCTAFGGAIAVVRDHALLTQMRTLYHSYPIQSRALYAKKVLKYSAVMTVLNSPFLVTRYALWLRKLGIDYRELMVNFVRGFPGAFFDNIRMRPSIMLLCMLYRRLKNFDASSFNLGNIKGNFVSERLPQGIRGVGLKAVQRNFWLFPILVNNPDRIVKELNIRGVDAYRGATQLNLVESDVPIPRTLQMTTTSVTRNGPSVHGHAGDTSRQQMTEPSSACENQIASDPTGLAPEVNLCGSNPDPEVPQEQRMFSDGVHSAISNIASNDSKEEAEDARNRIVRTRGLTMHSQNNNSTIPGISPMRSSSTAGRYRDSAFPAGGHFGEPPVAMSPKPMWSPSEDDPRSPSYSFSAISRNSETSFPEFSSPTFSDSHSTQSVTIATQGLSGKHQASHSSSVGDQPSSGPHDRTPHSSPVASGQQWHSHQQREPHARSFTHGNSSFRDFFIRGSDTQDPTSPQSDSQKQPASQCAPRGQTLNASSPDHCSKSSHSHPRSTQGGAHQCNCSSDFPEPDFDSHSSAPDAQANPNLCNSSSNQGGAFPPCSGNSPTLEKGKYPNNARYIIDHVVYIPVHKKVSFHYLEQICLVLDDVMNMLAKEKKAYGSCNSNNILEGNLKLKSKL